MRRQIILVSVLFFTYNAMGQHKYKYITGFNQEHIPFSQLISIDSSDILWMGKGINYSADSNLVHKIVDTFVLLQKTIYPKSVRIIQINAVVFIVEEDGGGSCGLNYTVLNKDSRYSLFTKEIGESCGGFDGVQKNADSFSYPQLYFTEDWKSGSIDDSFNRHVPAGIVGICQEYQEKNDKYIRSFVFSLNRGPIPLELYGPVYEYFIGEFRHGK